MKEKLEKLIFSLIIFSLASQAGLHFWPKFAYITGVRVDYLSPTLYLLDFLICLFILISLPNHFKKNIHFPKSNFSKIVISGFILDLLVNLFLVKSQGAHIFGIVKLIELVLLGISVSLFFKKQHTIWFTNAFAFSAIVSSVLAIWQFINQSSIGGLWYFFGERTFSITTIGISTVNINKQLLRSYGAFPHPNVLAFFLLVAITFLIHGIVHGKNLYMKVFYGLSIALSSLALIFTFSRVSMTLLIWLSIYAIYTKGKSNMKYVATVFVFILLFLAFKFQVISAQFLFRGFDFRQELFGQSLLMFQAGPFFGIGLNNFFINQSPLIKNISPINFQPVHNIFILALLSVGLLGFWVLPYMFYLAVRVLLKKIKTKNFETRDFYKCIFFLLISIIIVGMFDHFFLTVEQGQIILALVLGLSFTNLNSKKI